MRALPRSVSDLDSIDLDLRRLGRRSALRVQRTPVVVASASATPGLTTDLV